MYICVDILIFWQLRSAWRIMRIKGHSIHDDTCYCVASGLLQGRIPNRDLRFCPFCLNCWTQIGYFVPKLKTRDEYSTLNHIKIFGWNNFFYSLYLIWIIKPKLTKKHKHWCVQTTTSQQWSCHKQS